MSRRFSINTIGPHLKDLHESEMAKDRKIDPASQKQNEAVGEISLQLSDGSDILVSTARQLYKPQAEIVKALFSSWRDGNSALIESPTGTGKTLAFLTAITAFQQAVMTNRIAAPCNCVEIPVERVAPAVSLPSMPTKTEYQRRMEAKRREKADEEARSRAYVGNANDAWDAVGDLPMHHERHETLGPTTTTPQRRMTPGRVKGTPLRINNPGNEVKVKCPRVIFCSRTHSQLSQVIKEFRTLPQVDGRCRLPVPMASITAASRDRLCIDDAVSRMPSGFQKTSGCRAACQNGTCLLNRGPRGGVLPATAYPKDIEDLCSAGGNGSVSLLGTSASWIRKLDSLQDAESASLHIIRGNRFCPYFLALEALPQVPVLFVPYVYIFSPSLRESMGLQDVLKEAIVLIDEGHNLASTAEESFSYEIQQGDIQLVRSVIKVLAIGLRSISEPDDALWATALIPLLPKDFKHKKKIVSPKSRTTGDVEEDSRREKLTNFKSSLIVFEEALLKFEGLIQLDKGHCVKGEPLAVLTRKMRELLPSDGAAVLRRVAEVMAAVCNDASPSRTYGVDFQPERFGNFAKSCHRICNSIRVMNSDSLIRNVESCVLTRSGEGGTTSLFCLSPAPAIDELFSLGVRSIVISSGTLGDLDAVASCLGHPEKFSVRLKTSHVANTKKQAICIVVKKSSGSGMNIIGSYRSISADPNKYWEAVSLGLSEVSRSVPGGSGILVVLPSFSHLKDLLVYWEKFYNAVYSTGMAIFTERHRSFKDVEMEKARVRPLATAAEAAEAFKKHVDRCLLQDMAESEFSRIPYPRFGGSSIAQQQRGGVLLAVARGSLSEGINFSDHHARAVIQVGLPYPQLYEPRVKLKRKHLDDQTSGEGDRWYQREAFDAVNQSIGRCLRHKLDFGAIVLLDGRYEKQKEHLSAWAQDAVPEDSGDTNTELSLRKFFTNLPPKCLSDAESRATKLKSDSWQIYEEVRAIAHRTYLRESSNKNQNNTSGEKRNFGNNEQIKTEPQQRKRRRLGAPRQAATSLKMVECVAWEPDTEHVEKWLGRLRDTRLASNDIEACRRIAERLCFIKEYWKVRGTCQIVTGKMDLSLRLILCSALSPKISETAAKFLTVSHPDVDLMLRSFVKHKDIRGLNASILLKTETIGAIKVLLGEATSSDDLIVEDLKSILKTLSREANWDFNFVETFLAKI